MITLDALLATAQDSQSRKPLCRILSKENAASIPFDGAFLNNSSAINEQHPSAVVHSTGRLFVAFMVGPSAGNYTLRYGYTDVDQTYYTYVDFTLSAFRVGGEVTVCELADGNVGLIWAETYAGTRTVKYRKITVTGADLSPAVTGTILTNATSAFFAGPAVAKLADDSYLMVYGAMDGANYNLYYRTSADFVTWAAAVAVDLSTLTATKRKANPALIVLATGEMWLLFDYLEATGPNAEELTNIYYVSSSDNMATNAAAVALTAYTDYTEVGEHPTAVQTAAGTIYLAFNRVMASLHMDQSTTGWSGASSPISNMHIDVATQKLYVVSSGMTVGHKTFYSVEKIDLATWTVDKAWSTASVPAFSSYFVDSGNTWWDSYHGDGVYVPVGNSNGVIAVLNTQSDTITTYAFYDFAAYGISKNITWTPITRAGWEHITGMTLSKVWIDAATNRMYVALTRSYIYNTALQIGYIDLTAAGPSYTFTNVVTESGTISEAELYGFARGNGFMEINTAADFIIVGMEGWSTSYAGSLRIYSLSGGGLWKCYKTSTNPTFPYRGLKRAVYDNGLIVGTFTYEPLYGQADYRGLCTIDTASDVITYDRPSWATVDNYQLQNISIADAGEYVITAGTYGVTHFNGATWTLYNSTTVTGLVPSSADNFVNPILYNTTTDMVIAGSGAGGSAFNGLLMFSKDGYIKQSNYRIGTYGTGWTWTATAPLVEGFTDYNASLCLDSGGLYAFWVNKAASELSIKWDKDVLSVNLSAYLLRGVPVERSSTIDPTSGNWDAELTFSCSHGHLFDTSNNLSLLRQYLAKGRKLEQSFGENIGGVEYWEPAQIFTVSDDPELDYRRGDYPVVRVTAETPRRRWEQIHIIASEYYNATPEVIIADLLTTHANINASDISLGTWTGSVAIEYQFVDVFLSDAIDMIALHFGYAIRDGAGGTIEAVKITDAGTATRTYTDNTKLIKATPHNKYSNFTNRWIVECEENTFIELLMQEELAAELNASHRWNTGKKTYRVQYPDGKVYRNPRLEIVDSVESLGFKLAGGCDEKLEDNSHNEVDQSLWDTYCEVEVDSPDLTPYMIAGLAMLPATAIIGDHVVVGGFVASAGWTRPVGTFITSLGIMVCLNVLAATGNFYYRIFGQPVVKVRRTVQAVVDDLDLQTQMGGQIVPASPYTDVFCGSVADCQAVANYLKMVGMGERKRWKAEMVADLHNETGDTITVVHPHSNQAITVFLTDVKTTFLMPETGGNDGIFSQTFEGWRR